MLRAAAALVKLTRILLVGGDTQACSGHVPRSDSRTVLMEQQHVAFGEVLGDRIAAGPMLYAFTWMGMGGHPSAWGLQTHSIVQVGINMARCTQAKSWSAWRTALYVV